MINCPSCKHETSIRMIACEACDLKLEGEFMLPRLARLSPGLQKLAEQFLLSGGSLKTMSKELDISYPTLRKNLDDLIGAVETLQKNDNHKISNILIKIEKGDISSEKGLRLIKEMNGEL